MRSSVALFLFLAVIATGRADDKIAGVQQSLKDQGFYYGEITGDKNADTTAAIRRYQIRNGLQITGELNDETMRSLKSGAGSASASTPAAPAPVATAKPAVTTRTPSPAPAISDLHEEPPARESNDDEAPVPPRYAAPPAQDRQEGPIYPGRAVPSVGENFVGTPYETAPPEMQRQVIAKAQQRLARSDLYRGEITGVYGPDLEFSLRAYQSRVGLRPTGRLDLETLAALELLSGAGAPVYRPRRVLREPPVRGEWIRP